MVFWTFREVRSGIDSIEHKKISNFYSSLNYCLRVQLDAHCGSGKKDNVSAMSGMEILMNAFVLSLSDMETIITANTSALKQSEAETQVGVGKGNGLDFGCWS